MRISYVQLIPFAAAVLGGLLWWALRPAASIPVGVIAWPGSAAVVGSSEIGAADLFMEEHPGSRIQVKLVDDHWQAERTVPAVTAAMGEGVRFFASTHPSKCAVASIGLFTDGRALVISVASTAPVLTGRDDYFLRVVADADMEQRAIAREIARMPGRRLLVLRDLSNPPYTEPAFAAFAAELAAAGGWEVVHRPLMVAEFDPDALRPLMAEPFDALYILAGSFQSAIGNIAQLFHLLHPDAPIMLTPWARSPAILESAGAAIDRIILPSQYPPRREAPWLNAYFTRLRERFGYEPHAVTIGIRQALELFDRAFAQGYDTPAAVKRWLLSVPVHQTSLGPVAFDRFGDVRADFYFIRDVRRELE
jgi:branched-chain amino acid transport system substrate-binding protein